MDYIEFKLCKEFHCLPSDLENQSREKIENFIQFINLDYEIQKKEQRLAESKTKKRFPVKHGR